MVLLDTHVWLWWMGGLPQLKEKYHRALRQLPSPPMLSVISLWEVSLLVETAKIRLAPTPRQWMARATRSDAVQLVQVNLAVAEELLSLPSGMPRDPADRIIAATARALHVPVLTMDRQLLRSGAIHTWSV